MHGKADRHMKLLTLERESSFGSLWDQEQCAQFCLKDELWEAAKEEEMRIPWKEVQEGLPVPEDQYQERFWRRRLDGIGLDISEQRISGHRTIDRPFIVLTETKLIQTNARYEKQLCGKGDSSGSSAVQ